MLSKLIVALDVQDLEKAKSLVDDICPYVDIFKVGPTLAISSPQIIDFINEKGARVFLDLKLYDIPTTVARTVKSLAKLKIYSLSIHISGGLEMLKAALQSSSLLLWGVTVLTSFNQQDLKKLGINHSIEEQVINLAKLGQSAGLKGIICSPQEISLVRQNCGDEINIITPGIRLKLLPGDDQKRYMTPIQAIRQGADYIVIGRPIIEDKNPVEVVKNIIKEIGE